MPSVTYTCATAELFIYFISVKYQRKIGGLAGDQCEREAPSIV